MSDSDDKKVKDLIDAATRAELEKWFGLPSFESLGEQAPEPPPDDPEVAAVRERRDKAIAAVDPAMVEAHRRRVEAPEALITFKPMIDVHVDPSVALFDMSMIERQHTIADPREVDIPPELQDDLHDCTPQALLRDLHRPELDFEKVFEVVDMAAEQRFDIVAAVNEAMATSWKLPRLGRSPFTEARELLLELRTERRRPWTDIKMPNRRVAE